MFAKTARAFFFFFPYTWLGAVFNLFVKHKKLRCKNSDKSPICV